jgi:uncharacterized protein YcnI
MIKRLVAASVAAAMIPASAVAHVTVSPKSSGRGAWEKYDLRMPNEKPAAATTKLEVRFPAGLRVVSFEDKPGWTVEPLRDSAGAITGARWTGNLPPERFVDFGIVAVNPKEGADLVWSASQTYSDGTVVDWSGPKGSRAPAPVVELRPAER